MARSRRRTSTLRLVRALWRYRGRIAAHGDRYQEELATAVYSTLDGRRAGRLALSGYRAAMKVLLVAAIVLLGLGLGVAALLFVQVGHWSALAGLLLLLPAVWMLVARFSWGAPLDWIEEHADTTRVVTVDQLPTNLRSIAAELRRLADVPTNISRELDQLAGEVEAEQGPHVV
ncbi:MAG: hypothetical protein JWN72_115 [Thermoleophilia bacterium]|nr:hypothetical protein [Thermoleophilia bacterium]